MKKTLLLVIAGMTLVASNAFAEAGLCSDPLRQQDVCYRMKHLRSQINMLDAQRDLMQLNYPYLNAVGGDMKSLVGDILTRIRGMGEQHIRGLKEIERMAGTLETKAAGKDPDSLVLANQIRSKCLSCHASGSPSSGYDWKDISRNNWDDITKKCNAAFRNPYRCKNMYGMLTNYGYFLTALDADGENYEMAKMAAKEIVKVSKDLRNRGMVHAGEAPLKDVQSKAAAVERMAHAKDPQTFFEGAGIAQGCVACHGTDM